MKRLAALAIVVAAVAWARQGVPDPGASAGTTLALGLTLVVATLTGDALRRIRLPRLTGYLLFGLLIGPSLGNIISAPVTRQLQTIDGIATALIALIAGLMFNVERMGRRLPGSGRMFATTLGVAMSGLFAIAWVAWTWLPIAPEATGTARLVIAGLFAVMVISFSPTMTAAVVSETGARGVLTDLVLAIVVVADLVVLVLFSVLLQTARIALHASASGGGIPVLVRLTWEVGGAVAFGALVGAIFALYLRYVRRELTLAVLVVCVLLSQVGATQGFEPLLAAMSAGMIVQNIAVPQGEALKVAIERAALPVLIVFFVSVGASLHPDVLRTLGPVAVALAIVRIGLIRGGVSAGLRSIGVEPAVGRYVWTGLVSQAGITLGLASVLAAEFPTWGGRLQTVLASLIVIDELVGPVLFRIGLTRAGELDTVAERPLIVVSNREPYLHNYDRQGGIVCTPATGGVAVALDALMRERGGTWIAYGDGTADRATVSADDTIRVPPDNPAYQLRRLWIDRTEYAGYYGGFSNEGLWPLCHLVDVRPKFRAEDWAAYQLVNDRFAAAIDQELAHAATPVFIQDYHLALVAARLRARRPGVRTALFWHIPWPYPDRLRICPWHRPLLAGMLANDLVAFQLERDRRNFVLAVAEELDAEVEADGERVRHAGRTTTVAAVPIGVDFDRIQAVGSDPGFPEEQRRLCDALGLRAPIVGLGVDRLDYTKGIPERLEALDRVFTSRPDLRGQLTFLQIGVPSRSELGSYNAIAVEIEERVAELNSRHGRPGAPPPIVYHKGALPLRSLVALYRLAHFCVVSSLHDGMNLVAKEFVAARDDGDGVLVLSALAGAAQDLTDALIINPYDIDQFASAILLALDMAPADRRARMREMRRIVAGRNVFGWASDILTGLESLWTRPLQYASRAPEETPV